MRQDIFVPPESRLPPGVNVNTGDHHKQMPQKQADACTVAALALTLARCGRPWLANAALIRTNRLLRRPRQALGGVSTARTSARVPLPPQGRPGELGALRLVGHTMQYRRGWGSVAPPPPPPGPRAPNNNHSHARARAHTRHPPPANHHANAHTHTYTLARTHTKGVCVVVGEVK